MLLYYHDAHQRFGQKATKITEADGDMPYQFLEIFASFCSTLFFDRIGFLTGLSPIPLDPARSRSIPLDPARSRSIPLDPARSRSMPSPPAHPKG